ncbi:MAG: hypothetical protein L3J49_01835 [Desulfobulbaceae bacterium]|nr:hypothetical protein [Desulfobulbaceae bacterium]
MTKRIMHLIGIAGLFFLVGGMASAGELDPDFGVDGRVAIEIGTHGDRTQAVAIQSDGKILLGGASTNGDSLSFSLIRLLADGSPDSSFNGDGTVLLDLARGDDEILALGLTPDGHIFAGGYTTNGTDRDFSLLRFNADGSLDSNFGNQGKVFTSVGNSDDEITALVALSNGDVLVVGSAAGTNGRVIVLARYLEDGRLDPGFADHGLSLTGIGQDVVAQGMAVDRSGRIIISGSYTDGAKTRMVLVGFTPDGLVDKDFGENGVAAAAYTKKVSEGYGLFQAAGGDFFIAGSVGVEGERDAALFHFTAQGAPDVSFGEDGVLVSEVGPEDDVLYSLVGSETRINGVGFTTENSSRDFLLLSYERKGGKQQAEPVSAGAEQKTGSLHIGELLVTDSFAAYEFEPVADNKELLEPTVMTTSFGMGESVSYAVAMQKDGKVVTVGTSGENGQTSAVVARYTVSEKITPATKSAVPFNINVSTLPPNEVDATSAFSGGNINPGLGAVTQRGVVFSIAPYPVCKTDCADGVADNPIDPGGGTDTTAPVPTSTTKSNFTSGEEVILSVSTNESATCKYNKDSDTDYGSMSNFFNGVKTTTHTKSFGVQADASYKYFVRCTDAAGNTNSAGTKITFTVGASSAINGLNRTTTLLAEASAKIGDFLVPAALAVDTTTGTTTGTTTTSTTSTSIYFDTSFIKKEGYTIDGAGSGLYSSILEKLTPDTRYYVRAYAIVNNTVYYGQQYEFETSSACFIATAAYGSILNPAVVVLREFRDQYLKTNHLGRQLVAWYYKNSPPIADRIAASNAIRFVVRIALLPVIAVSWMLLHPGLMSMVFWMACLTVILLRLRRRCIHTPST